MEKQDIIIAGLSGEEVGKELRQTLNSGYSLLVCSESTRLILEKELETDFKKCWISFIPLAETFEKIRKFSVSGKIVIITSGDPLFFGFGATILRKYPHMKVRFIPAVSSMQLCCSRFSIPWEQASFLSLHGRRIEELKTHLHDNQLFILTDKVNTPTRIARQLLGTLSETQWKQYTVMVGERLGLKDEKLFKGSLEETADSTFSSPNCVILQRSPQKSEKRKARFGLREDEIRHSRGLITKDEVRAAVLHKLCLPDKGVFWDVGAGSGSISIEASRLNPELTIFSIERKKEEIENISFNSRTFGCNNIHIMYGEAPGIFSQLPAPDCVFIGGSGGRLEQIIKFLNRNTLCRNVVITAVTEKTAAEAPVILLKNNFVVKKSTISVTRYTLFPEQDACAEEEKLNTIHVISGEKQNGRND